MHENSSKRRRERKLERKAGKRPSYPRVLLVCEGEKTEPNYFREIRRFWSIPTAHWEVLPSDFGTGPEKVVEFAEFKARSEGLWDEVYCIFDRDQHEHYQEAIEQTRRLDGKLKTAKPMTSPVRFMAIPSIPCFELWFVLHFQTATREEQRHTIKHRLENCIPGYDKYFEDMFERTKDRLPIAYRNATNARKRKAETGNGNPSTDADILVKRLHEIGEMKNNPHHTERST